MKKILSLGLLLMIAIVGYAQNVDHFEVGPYEVDYRGEGDFKYRLKKGMDIYKYFGLQKDTVVQQKDDLSTYVAHAIQIEVSFMLPRYAVNSCSNVFGIDGTWKQRITDGVYFNGGLSLAMAFCKYGTAWNDENESLFEIGVPLSIEFANIDKRQSSLYGGIGVVPTFYGSTKEINDVGGKSGLFVAPRIDFGGYIPVGNTLIRLGGFAQYNLNCAKDDHDKDVFKERIGRLFLGANIGLVL